MALTLGVLIVAAILVFGIYKALNGLYSVLPGSFFRVFMQSTSGNVLTGFISLIILYMAFVCIMINSGVHC